MAKRRRRPTGLITLTTPRGSAWTVPRARPIDVLARVRHQQYLDALESEQPSLYRSVLAHTRRLAERYTKKFKRRKQNVTRYEQSQKSSS